MKKEKTYFIYGLVDPLTKKIEYVGCTINTVTRYKQHIYSSKNPKIKKDFWVQSILKTGYKPEMVIIDQVTTIDRAVALNLEHKYIMENKSEKNTNKTNDNGMQSFYIDVETTNNAKLYCKYNNISLSEVINDLLLEWSKEHKDGIDICLKKQIKVDEIIKNNIT